MTIDAPTESETKIIVSLVNEIDSEHGEEAKFGALRDTANNIHCLVDASDRKLTHLQLVRTLMKRLFRIDPDISTEIIPQEFRDMYNTQYVGAGTVCVSRLKRCADIAYGQTSIEFGSKTCSEELGFSEPQDPSKSLAITRGLILWSREHLVPFLNTEDQFMQRDADKRMQFENDAMQVS